MDDDRLAAKASTEQRKENSMKSAIAATMVAAFSLLGVGQASAATPDIAQTSFVAANPDRGSGSGSNPTKCKNADKTACPNGSGPRGSKPNRNESGRDTVGGR
ncbi:hypothetical protein [Nocardia sp. NPDC050406]|uniref:hypothetical protein n=1 Tax=Nocardia sp. NPDC050406 TaxID=3364318 RepID=UPI00379E5DCD